MVTDRGTPVTIWCARAVELCPTVLEGNDRSRWWQLRHPPSRARLASAAVVRDALLREVAGHRVRIVRRCSGCGSSEHGAPRTVSPGTENWSLSVTHAGPWVAVALVATGERLPQVCLGIDLEEVSRFRPDLAPVALTARERSLGSARTPWAFAGAWTAKEAVLKAAGTGLQVPLTAVEVLPGGQVVLAPDAPLPHHVRDRPGCLVDIGDLVAQAVGESSPPNFRAHLFASGTTSADVRVRTVDVLSLAGTPAPPAPAEHCSGSRGGPAC